MTATPWIVVSHTSDESPAANGVAHLMRWLDAQPDIDLHTVLWSVGHIPPGRYDFGHLRNVGKDHERLAPKALRRVGLARLGGGLAGRAVRSTLRGLPDSGVLFLSSARSVPVLRYLPSGNRVVVTHLHDDDCRDLSLTPDKRSALVAVTDVWLAADDSTREWTVSELGVDRSEVHLVPEPIDLTSASRAVRQRDPGSLRIAVVGAPWFERDHTARVVQALRSLAPGVALHVAWAHPVADRAHLAPLMHDLDNLDMGRFFSVPATFDEAEATLRDIDALVLTTPGDRDRRLTRAAAAEGVPVVCFDSHPDADFVSDGVGVVVEYLDIVAMASAVLAVHSEDHASAEGVHSVRSRLRARDAAVLGERVRTLVDQAVGGAR